MNEDAESRKLAIEALKEAPPAILLLRPIDYIFADHFRLRTLCKLLDEIAEETELDLEKMQTVLHFLETDFGKHVADEEEDLFPLLLRQAAPEDSLDDLLAELSRDHVSNARVTKQIIKELTDRMTVSGARTLKPNDRKLLQRFAKHEKRHLTLENAIVLPLARARLTSEDLRNLGKHMASRRGLAYPEEKNAL